ncbi:MAG: acetyltransferase [Bacteroidaceae bacterium]
MKIIYFFLFFLWYILSLLPFWILYRISDLLYFPLYYGIRYRRRVVRKNLVESFPEKDFSEILKIEKNFYHYFCDYFIETLKLFSISRNTISKRMHFEGIELLNERLKEQNCVVYLGHYCNWEWIVSLPLHTLPGITSAQIYHELENKAFNGLFLRLRGRFGAVNIKMKQALRQLLHYNREHKRFVVGFIADQSPNWNSINLWTNFLNHDSAVFTGAERMARKVEAAVFYLDITRVKRGYYCANFVEMTNRPSELDEDALTIDYTNRLEQSIRKNPQYWLWSHNRWKRTHADYLKRMQINS